MTATLPQATKLLQLAAKMTNEQMQAHLEMGTLAELLAFESPRDIDRSELHEFLCGQMAKANSIEVIDSFTLKPYKGKGGFKQLIEAGSYRKGVEEWITEDRFTPAIIGSVDEEVEYVLVKSENCPDSNMMLALARFCGWERPTAGDALRFGIQRPSEQCKHPLVFLHEPVVALSQKGVLSLSGDAGWRTLTLACFDGARPPYNVYVFVRERKKV